jgi:hypothetical protein
MTHEHTLRSARRARGEDHVAEVVGAREGRRVSVGLRRQPLGHSAEVDDRAHRPQASSPVRHQHLDRGVAADELQALGGSGGVERHVGAARLEDGEEGHHQLARPLEQRSHPHLRSHPQPAQVPRQAVGPPVEIAVGPGLASEGHRRRFRSPRHLRLEERLERPLLASRQPAGVPGEQLPAFLRAQQGELRERQARVRHGAGEEAQEASGEAFDGGAVEQGGAEAERSREARPCHSQGEAEVEFLALRRDLPEGRREIAQAQVRRRLAIQGEGDLEEGRNGESARRLELLDQLFERQILMGVGGERDLPHARQQRGERRLAGEVGAHDQRVDEEADQPLGPQLAAAGDRRPDADVGGPGEAGKQGLEAPQKGHEEGHSLASCERPQRAQQSGRQGQGAAGAAVAHLGRPRAIERQFEHRWRIRQPGPPVRQLGLQELALEPAPLPDRVVAILDLELRQG